MQVPMLSMMFKHLDLSGEMMLQLSILSLIDL